MQTSIKNLEESKPITAGAVTTFNVNAFSVIKDLYLEFTNSGAPATLANCKASIPNIKVLLNGINILDVSVSQIADLFTFLGTRVQQTALTNVFSLNLGRLLYRFGIARDEFAWRCGKQGETNPSKKISSLIVQVTAAAEVTGITDVSLYSERLDIQAEWNDSYIQFNNNFQTFTGTGQSQVNTLPKNAEDLFLLAIAYNGGGVISQGETLINNQNISRTVSLAVNNAINNLEGYGVISGAFVHNFMTGSINSGLFVNDITSELSVRTTFTTAPTAGYDMPVLKIHNCPARIKQLVISNDLQVIDTVKTSA